MSDWGDRIKQRRTELGLTAAKLAQAAGVKPPSVSEWENDITKNISGENLVAVARALETTPDWIMTGEAWYSYATPRPSQPARLDPQKLLAAYQMLREVYAAQGDEYLIEERPDFLAYAYEHCAMNEGRIAESSLVNFGRWLAEREQQIRGERGQSDTGPAGGNDRRSHRKQA